MLRKKAAAALPPQPQYVNPYPNSGFNHPPVVKSTGNADIDELVSDYNIAAYLKGCSSDPAGYILKAEIATPEGWTKPQVIQTFKGLVQSTALDNFEDFVVAFANGLELGSYRPPL